MCTKLRDGKLPYNANYPGISHSVYNNRGIVVGILHNLLSVIVQLNRNMRDFDDPNE